MTTCHFMLKLVKASHGLCPFQANRLVTSNAVVINRLMTMTIAEAEVVILVKVVTTETSAGTTGGGK